MFLTGLYTSFIQSANNIISSTATSITGVILPVFGTFVMIYYIMCAWKIIKEGDSVILSELVGNSIKLGFILVFIGSSGWYVSKVVPMFLDLAESIARGITGSKSDSMTLVDTFWQAFDPAFKTLNEASKHYKWYWVGQWVTYGWNVLVLSISQLLISFTITLNLIICKFMLALTLSVGTIFIAFAFFESTRNFFNLWVGQVLNYCFLTLFYTLSAHIIATYITDQVKQSTGSLAQVFALSWQIFVLSLILVTLLSQLSGLAQGLAGGYSMSTSGGLGRGLSKGAGVLGSMGRAGQGMKSLGNMAKSVGQLAKAFKKGLGK